MCAARCCAAAMSVLRTPEGLRLSLATAALRRPILPCMPPPVWLQTFCSPSSLLLCGCLSLESAPHHAIHLLRTPRLTILPCIPNISSFAPAPPPLPFSHRSAPSSHCSNLLAQCCSAVQCSLVQVKQPVAAGSNVTARSATAVRSLKRQLVIAPRCRPGCLWPG